GAQGSFVLRIILIFLRDVVAWGRRWIRGQTIDEELVGERRAEDLAAGHCGWREFGKSDVVVVAPKLIQGERIERHEAAGDVFPWAVEFGDRGPDDAG